MLYKIPYIILFSYKNFNHYLLQNYSDLIIIDSYHIKITLEYSTFHYLFSLATASFERRTSSCKHKLIDKVCKEKILTKPATCFPDPVVGACSSIMSPPASSACWKLPACAGNPSDSQD